MIDFTVLVLWLEGFGGLDCSVPQEPRSSITGVHLGEQRKMGQEGV